MVEMTELIFIKKTNTICPICGETFQFYPRRSRPLKPCCSRKCSNIQRTKMKLCPVCGKKFRYWKLKQVHCSRRCMGVASRKQTRFICNNCSKPFWVPNSWILRKSHFGKYCSVRCAAVGRVRIIEKREVSKYVDHQGYVNLYIDGKRIKEHRFIVEQQIGHPLLPTEIVHHKNGIRNDNRFENLEVWIKGHPIGQRIADVSIGVGV